MRGGAVYGTAAVCVSPTRVALAAARSRRLGAPSEVAAVVGFPSGAHRPAVKALEARLAVADGATEIDVVIDLGRAADGNWSAVEAELVAVRAEVPGVLKVILETGLLDADGIVAGCRVAAGGRRRLREDLDRLLPGRRGHRGVSRRPSRRRRGRAGREGQRGDPHPGAGRGDGRGGREPARSLGARCGARRASADRR